MLVRLSSAASAVTVLVAMSSAIALAAPKPFTGPPGWDHTVATTPTPQTPRAQETWKKSDGELMTYLSDGGMSYDDIVAMVKKNLADNAFKPTVDTDRKCDGRRAHELEIVFGTAVVHQVIVDDAPGVTKLTYTRSQGTPAAPDVTTALTAYCGPAQ
ncbi:MAG: hypothetical protein JWO66_241 [Candidatus Eremiobacteraeota bacterium]|nr:hypothetical protein [Candidatus Eremiobacteraeota bacterium]